MPWHEGKFSVAPITRHAATHRNLENEPTASSFLAEAPARSGDQRVPVPSFQSIFPAVRAVAPGGRTQVPRIKVPTLMMWGMKDAALSHRMARPSMDYCDEGNLILFPDATHWVQLDAAEEVNHYLIDFLLDKISTQVIQ